MSVLSEVFLGLVLQRSPTEQERVSARDFPLPKRFVWP